MIQSGSSTNWWESLPPASLIYMEKLLVLGATSSQSFESWVMDQIMNVLTMLLPSLLMVYFELHVIGGQIHPLIMISHYIRPSLFSAKFPPN